MATKRAGGITWYETEAMVLHKEGPRTRAAWKSEFLPGIAVTYLEREVSERFDRNLSTETTITHIESGCRIGGKVFRGPSSPLKRAAELRHLGVDWTQTQDELVQALDQETQERIGRIIEHGEPAGGPEPVVIPHGQTDARTLVAALKGLKGKRNVPVFFGGLGGIETAWVPDRNSVAPSRVSAYLRSVPKDAWVETFAQKSTSYPQETVIHIYVAYDFDDERGGEATLKLDVPVPEAKQAAAK